MKAEQNFTQADVDRYRQNYLVEMDGIALYRSMAAAEKVSARNALCPSSVDWSHEMRPATCTNRKRLGCRPKSGLIVARYGKCQAALPAPRRSSAPNVGTWPHEEGACVRRSSASMTDCFPISVS